MTQINIRMDDALKEQADALFTELGLNMTTAFTMFVRQTLRTGGIPFAVTTNPDLFYSAANMKTLRQSIQEANDGKLTKHELIDD
ncbi:DNA-damage-inducible protein J [Bacteroidia bacterium]|nr:DNA-damage-inducible protein J [Bacteroidia bacterium]